MNNNTSLGLHTMEESESKKALQTDFIRISRDEFFLIAKLIKDKFGISLPESKLGLVESRLNKELKQKRLAKFKDYYQLVVDDKSGAELQKLANMISTNHTFFNRENSHFAYFKDKVLPELSKRSDINRRKDLRVWCCASSSGEEPIMIMMMMLEYFGVDYQSWTAGLLATDISLEVLTKAKKGEYEANNLDNLPKNLKEKYFDDIGSSKFRIKSRVLQEIKYARYNLVTGAYQFSSPFHVIFCRNVMIYFDNETKEKVVNSLYNCLIPGGYLFVGHAESLNGLNHPYHNILPAVYKK